MRSVLFDNLFVNYDSLASEAKRAEMTANLQRDVEALRAPVAGASGGPGGQFGFTNTKVRQPTHYECIRGMQALQETQKKMEQAKEAATEEVLKWDLPSKKDISTMY